LNVDAVVTSVGEPQFERCMESVKNQTVPFANIIDIRDHVPVCSAFNDGVSQVQSEWFMHVAGDEVLYEDAVERVIKHVEQDNDEKTCGYFFGLQDTFLDWTIGFATFMRTAAYKAVVRPNRLSDDRKVNRMMRKRGWIIKKEMHFVVGTHFDKPDEFQVFSRFYPQTIKYMRYSYARDRLSELYEKTGDPLYQFGIKTIDFARQKKFYPGSKNNIFDRELYCEFKNENGGNNG